MHPAIRILGVAGLILCVSPGHWPVIGAATLAVAVAFYLSHLRVPGRVLPMAWRLRWLFLSIVVLFGWFTPGAEILPVLGRWSPTHDGLIFGARRVLVLVVIVAAVAWLLETTSRDALVRGLLWIAAPFACLGFPHERFAARLALVIEAAPGLRLSLRESVTAEAEAIPLRGKIALAAARMAGLYAAAVDEAERRAGEEIDIGTEHTPRPTEWLLLALVLLPIAGIAVLFRP